MSEPSQPPPDRPLLPSDWEELAPLIDQVLDADPGQRDVLIELLSKGDPGRSRALEHLVAECERNTPLLDQPAGERFAELAAAPDECLLPPVVADRYRIGRELGHGGMARVYLAHDLKHGRDVAIKVIRPELSISLGHERFLREIEIAARLRHPNIVPLYDSGDVGGILYFVMPYEEGPSLGARLDEVGALPVADALSVLRDVARALAYAHEHGVVHRDVKPDNVMLSGGAAVVTDFGIAKAVSAALTDAGGPALTQTGSSVGTPAYIAPEQATGDPSTDHRADLYSFGCLAYELFAGHPPFHGQSTHQVIAAHITTVPQPIGELRPEVPPDVAALIGRCLEKAPAARPQAARDILGVLDAAKPGAVTLPLPSPLPPATSKPRRLALQFAMLAAAAVIGLALFVAFSRPEQGAPVTVAVLPFGNTNLDSTLTFVAEGLAEDVATALARVPGIVIKSRSGARSYRGQLGPDVTEAGARLKADYILVAVVRQERGNWILSADLGRASDAASLWSENFNLSPDQHAGAAERIATSLVASLRRQFPRSIGSAPALAAQLRTTNDEAYRLWLRGQEKLSRRGQSVSESADLFRQAIHLDTAYARAYSGLSMALALYPHFEGVPPSEVRGAVASAAQRALQLDPSLAQPHIALGLTHQFAYQWDSAGTEFERAVQLDSHDVEARVQYARHLLFRGRTADAMGQLMTARDEDPASALVLSWVSYAYYLDGRIDSALVESRRALENDPENFTTVSFGAIVRIGAGLLDEARALYPRQPPGSSSRTWILARAGDTAAARAELIAEDAESPRPWLAETRRAFSNLGLGDTARALTALERATDANEIWSSMQPLSDPLFDDLRASPRFQAVVRRVGLSDPGSRRRR